MIFIGYDGMTNYRIWDPATGKIIITPHVDFDENFDEIAVAVDVENSNANADQSVDQDVDQNADLTSEPQSLTQLPDQQPDSQPQIKQQPEQLRRSARTCPFIFRRPYTENADADPKALHVVRFTEPTEFTEFIESIKPTKPEVLSTRTDISLSLAEAKCSSEW